MVDVLWARIIHRYWYLDYMQGQKHGLITMQEKSNARRKLPMAIKTT